MGDNTTSDAGRSSFVVRFLVCVGLCWFVLVCVDVCWFVLVCVGVCWFVLVCVGLCWFVLVELLVGLLVGLLVDWLVCSLGRLVAREHGVGTSSMLLGSALPLSAPRRRWCASNSEREMLTSSSEGRGSRGASPSSEGRRGSRGVAVVGGSSRIARGVAVGRGAQAK